MGQGSGCYTIGEWYNGTMKCKKCSKDLVGKQTSYCSPYCSKLHLKSLYRKRKSLEISEYKKGRIRTLSSSRNKDIYLLITDKSKCRSCGSKENLTVNHIVPKCIGGGDEKENLEVLCNSCNSVEYHKIVIKALRQYFKEYFK